jgi:ABC-2 type transport system permease protein
MNKIFHVAVREFLATVLTKGFLIGFVIVPVIILLTIYGMKTMFTQEAPRIEGEIAVMDPTGQVHEELRDYLLPERIAERRDDFEKKVEEQMPEGMRQVADSGAMADARRQALDAMRGEVPKLTVNKLDAGADLESEKEPLRAGEITDGGRLALVVVHEDSVIPKNKGERCGNYDLYIREKLDDRIVDEIKRGLWDSIVNARVSNAGLDRDYIDALTDVGRVRSRTVTEAGEKETNEILNTLMPGAFMLLLFASVMTGGQSLMTTTVEEKASRVAEVLLSAVSPMQLMTGKIIGQMLVGFVILTVYAGMGVGALIVFALFGELDPINLLYLAIFYLIAYFVIASLLASIGAAVNEMREAQSLMAPVMMVLIIPWVLWLPISRAPDSLFSMVMSFLPPVNPFVMMIRIASTSPPPWWQVWLSIAIGAASVYGALWFAGKVFRIGLLMFGKPPNFATLIKWVRMA